MQTPLWVLEYFVPVLATIFNNVVYFAPMSAVWAARRKNDLGALNPYPWVFSASNCFGWVVYSAVKPDMFLFWSVFPGFAFSMFYLLTAVGILASKRGKSEDKVRSNIEVMMMSAVTIWGILCMVISQILVLSPEGLKIAITMVGYIDCSSSILFLISPLSSLLTIIRSKDSSSIYLPMALANVVNTTLWLIYGLIKEDPFLWVPNVLGFSSTIPQLVLVFLYPARAQPDAEASKNKGDDPISVVIQSLSTSSKEASGLPPPRSPSKSLARKGSIHELATSIHEAVRTSVKAMASSNPKGYLEVQSASGDH